MTEYDNLCKYLAEKHPDRFASWLLGRKVSGTKVFKTELSDEYRDQIIHLPHSYSLKLE